MLGGSGNPNPLSWSQEYSLESELLELLGGSSAYGQSPNIFQAETQTDFWGPGYERFNPGPELDTPEFQAAQTHAPEVHAPLAVQSTPVSIRVSQGEVDARDPMTSSLVNIVINPPQQAALKSLPLPPIVSYVPEPSPDLQSAEDSAGSVSSDFDVKEESDDSDYDAHQSDARKPNKRKQSKDAYRVKGATKVTKELRAWAKKVIYKEIKRPNDLTPLELRALRLEKNKKSAQEARDRKKAELAQLESDFQQAKDDNKDLKRQIKEKNAAVAQADLQAEIDAETIAKQRAEISSLKAQLEEAKASAEEGKKQIKQKDYAGFSVFCMRLHAALLRAYEPLGISSPEEVTVGNAPMQLAALIQKLSHYGVQLSQRLGQQIRVAQAAQQPTVQVDVHVPVTSAVVSTPRSYLPQQKEHMAKARADELAQQAAQQPNESESKKITRVRDTQI